MDRTQVNQPEIRQACYADHAGIRDFLTGLSPRARYLRFFTGAVSMSPPMLRLLAGGGDHIDALVAVENGVIIGHAMASDITGPGGSQVTEIGVVVTDARQGRGIGSSLTRALTARAMARGISTATMEVLTENRQVLAMIGHIWPAARHDRAGVYTTIHARLARPGEGTRPRPIARRPRRPGQEGRGERLAIAR